MSSQIVHLTAATHFLIKLTSNNFLSWRKQVLSTLIGLELDHHIVDQHSPPSQTITSGDTTKPNPEYLRWFRQDQMIISALLRSCSDQIQHILSSAETARKAWTILNSRYASGSRSRIISLKSRLAKNPQGTHSISEYLHDMKSIFDELAIAQSPIPEEKLIVHIMNQLSEDYATLVAGFKTRDTTVTFSELFEKLLDHERTIKEINTALIITTVNQTRRQPARNYSRSAGYSSNNKCSGHSANNRAAWSSRFPYNHTRQSRTNAYCSYCNIPGHDTKDCRKLGRFLRDHNIHIQDQSSTAPVVNFTSPQHGSTQPAWMWDIGASGHTANKQNSVPVLSEYGGPDEIVLGDGSTHGGASHAGSERQ